MCEMPENIFECVSKHAQVAIVMLLLIFSVFLLRADVFMVNLRFGHNLV